ncbi:MAG TPA: dicarboxylate/amino acid:cation symporter [Candidatus Avirikenella pullistercoris]|nr:dicarboxylate/amino acid:cation symporter [Candidatus Avirikenella pullistercoris]
MKILSSLNKLGLLPKVAIAIVLGICFSFFFPRWAVGIFVTINGIFGNFLSFTIPLIILGLVAPGIAELGKGAGRLLGITALFAYVSTLLSGFFSFFTCDWIYPKILDNTAGVNELTATGAQVIEPFFTVAMPPMMDVTSSLLFAFVMGLGVAGLKEDNLRNVLMEFREVVVKLITAVIIPFLPIYIFGIFLKMGAEGQVASVMSLFLKVIIVIFVMHVLLLLFQYAIAGSVVRKNPLKLLKNMLPAYATALGTQSSAATIPVTLEQTKKNGVNPELAGFVIPLCATIHLAGSILKIVACAMAIMYMMGMPIGLGQYAGFIMMLGITMVAAPGVPGGAIMAALGLLQSMLGFDETLQALMIALYIAMDSFGTACNVTGDGAIALIIDRIHRRKKEHKAAPDIVPEG